jgi:hypothetical protein
MHIYVVYIASHVVMFVKLAVICRLFCCSSGFKNMSYIATWDYRFEKGEKKLKSRGRESNPRSPAHESDALSITPSIHMYEITHLWYIYFKLLIELKEKTNWSSEARDRTHNPLLMSLMRYRSRHQFIVTKVLIYGIYIF